MPSAPPRRCPRPGCREFAPCTTHKPGQRSTRAADWHKLYTRAWDRASKAFLSENPLCADPLEEHGPLVPATCTDHIIPHRGDVDLFWDSDNWRPLCRACNSKLCALKQGGFGNTPKE